MGNSQLTINSLQLVTTRQLLDSSQLDSRLTTLQLDSSPLDSPGNDHPPPALRPGNNSPALLA